MFRSAEPDDIDPRGTPGRKAWSLHRDDAK
jgi:hypothetical protein